MVADVHGTSLHYEANLPAGALAYPVLFLHGWGCDGAVFRPFYEKMNLPWITLDFPGHGKSPEPPIPWSVHDYAEQVAELLRRLQVEKVSIVAHSFGGRVAVVLAAEHPEWLNRMVITGGAGIQKPQTEAQARRSSHYRTMQGILNRVKTISPMKGSVEWLQKSLQNKYASPDYLALSDSMKETFKKIVNEDLTPLLRKNQAPTLLIWGTEDTETPLWMGQKMEEEMKDAALIPFEGRSHFAFAEEPQRFMLIIQPFLKGEAE